MHGMNVPSSLARRSRRRSQAQQWQRNKPSIYADLGLALFFFVCAKLHRPDHRRAARRSRRPGCLVLVQRFVQASTCSAAWRCSASSCCSSRPASLWWFQDEEIVKMKGTWLGLLTATLFLSDGLLRQGRYFGRRLARYVMQPVSEQRLAIGLGLIGATMASLNWGVAKLFSTDVWLAYTTFGDIVLSMLLFFAVLRFAALKPESSASAP